MVFKVVSSAVNEYGRAKVGGGEARPNERKSIFANPTSYICVCVCVVSSYNTPHKCKKGNEKLGCFG